jgi:hypothetical protein
MTDIQDLLEAMPDPEQVDGFWRQICREMVSATAAAEYERGRAAGYAEAIADVKRLQHQLVLDAELETRRWGPGGRAHFADARDGDYPGRGSAAA